MSIKVMADNNVEISAKQDGALYNMALNNKDFIISGIGNEMEVERVIRNAISVKTGECVIHGRHVTIDEKINYGLPLETSGYLVVRIDLTQPIGQEAMIFSTPTLVQQEINWDGTIYDLPLVRFTTGALGIMSFEDVRVVLDKITDSYTKEETDQKIADAIGSAIGGYY